MWKFIHEDNEKLKRWYMNLSQHPSDHRKWKQVLSLDNSMRNSNTFGTNKKCCYIRNDGITKQIYLINDRLGLFAFDIITEMTVYPVTV